MITLTPAYGRDYKSKSEFIADLQAGKDFIFNAYGSPWDGKPANIESLSEYKGKPVNIRYGKLRKVAVITL
jgi:hypothetical protein